METCRIKKIQKSKFHLFPSKYGNLADQAVNARSSEQEALICLPRAIQTRMDKYPPLSFSDRWDKLTAVITEGRSCHITSLRRLVPSKPWWIPMYTNTHTRKYLENVTNKQCSKWLPTEGSVAQTAADFLSAASVLSHGTDNYAYIKLKKAYLKQTKLIINSLDVNLNIPERIYINRRFSLKTVQ